MPQNCPSVNLVPWIYGTSLMTTHVSHNNFCVLYIALGTIDTIFSRLPLKEPFFYDSFDSLLFVDKSPISIFIFLSLLSLCISQCSVNISTWYTLTTSLISRFYSYFLITVLCEKFPSPLHICYSIITRLLQNYLPASSNLSLSFLIPQLSCNPKRNKW